MDKRVWVLGDAVVDLLPDDDDRLRQCPGGAPANVAVGIARLGGESAFIGCVGGDPFGDFLSQVLQKEQVNIDYLQQLPLQRTSTVLVGLDPQGERSFTFMVRPSADLFLTREDIPSFSSGDALHFCSIALSAEPSRSAVISAVDSIHAAGGWVSFDPNLRDDIWTDKGEMHRWVNQACVWADVIKLSLDELHVLTGEKDIDRAVAHFCAAFTPSLLVITLGSDGVIVRHRGATTHFPAPSVKVVDSTGAGDAFVAGLLTGLMQEEQLFNIANLKRVMAVAQQCGALATTAKGAMTALPYLNQLQNC